KPTGDKGKKQVEKEKEMEGDAKEETLPPGFRFHPTDEELITHYLQNKISDADFSCRAIGDVDLKQVRTMGSSRKSKNGRKGVVFLQS
ncbi:PROTEIN CUP-SHAPED COTYLEDON 2-RELATED, partial [Salix viminalis]